MKTMCCKIDSKYQIHLIFTDWMESYGAFYLSGTFNWNAPSSQSCKWETL